MRAVDFTILRLPGVFGPGKTRGVVNDFIDAAFVNAPLVIHNRESRYKMAYIEDVLNALDLVLDHHSEKKMDIYHIAGQDVFTLERLARMILRDTQSRSEVQVIQGGHKESLLLDTKKAQRELKFLPLGLDASVQQFVEWKRHLSSS